MLHEFKIHVQHHKILFTDAKVRITPNHLFYINILLAAAFYKSPDTSNVNGLLFLFYILFDVINIL